MSKRARGKAYEDIARKFLTDLGYRFRSANYRYARKEIDLIFADGDELVFVEVKGGASHEFGAPVHKVDQRKQQAIVKAARGYLSGSVREYDSYRFDVVIVDDSEGDRSIQHIKSAFTL